MSKALEIFQTRWSKLAACRNSARVPQKDGFIDPRLKPFDACAKAHERDHFPGEQFSLIAAPSSERKVAINLAKMLRDVSTAEIPASVIPNAIQATHRSVTRRALLNNPLAPAVITQSVDLITEEIISISPNNDLVIASKNQGSRQLDVITGQPSILSTDEFKSLEDTLDAVKKAA